MQMQRPKLTYHMYMQTDLICLKKYMLGLDMFMLIIMYASINIEWAKISRSWKTQMECMILIWR